MPADGVAAYQLGAQVTRQLAGRGGRVDPVVHEQAAFDDAGDPGLLHDVPPSVSVADRHVVWRRTICSGQTALRNRPMLVASRSSARE